MAPRKIKEKHFVYSLLDVVSIYTLYRAFGGVCTNWIINGQRRKKKCLLLALRIQFSVCFYRCFSENKKKKKISKAFSLILLSFRKLFYSLI